MGIRGHIAVCICVALAAIAAVASTRVPAKIIYSPAEAAAHAGQSVTIEGQASVYLSRNGITFIDLGGSGVGSPFAAVVFKEDAKIFPNVFSYDGKIVDVSGPVKTFRGKPQIVLKSAEQLQIK